MTESYIALTLSQLKTTLSSGPPENDARDEGYALVNVLPEDQFRKEHIRGSINISKDDLASFGDRFDTEKKIVVHCASPECSASRETAQALVEKGFRHVFDFEGGMSEWREAGNPVEGEEGG